MSQALVAEIPILLKFLCKWSLGHQTIFIDSGVEMY